MSTSRWLAGLALVVSLGALTRPAAAQPAKAVPPDKVLPPVNRAARLVLTSTGPHAPVTALAFTPDGSALFVGGFDKLVRRYTLGNDGFAPDGAFRVPIGPGNGGVINALAVSPDGKTVAAAGRAPIRGEVWSGGEDALLEDTRFDSDEMRGDAGVIYLFDPKTLGAQTAIRGQLGEVRALTFASPAPAAGPVLVSAGIERARDGSYSGALRVFDAKTGAQLAEHTGLPNTTVPPGLAAWTDKKGLRVALAWDAGDAKPGKLLLWDDPRPGSKPTAIDDGAFNSTVAVRRDKGGAAELLVSGGYYPRGKKNSGGLAVRDLDGAEKDFVSITDAMGTAHLPVGVASFRFDGKGVVAVVSRISPAVKGGPRRHELRVTTAEGEAKVELRDINELRKPVFAVAPNGRFVAVGGFAYNHVDVYSTTELLAGRGREPQKLTGARPGFAKVAFLEGEKLWLGLPSDSLEKGGVILDLSQKARVAVPRGANEKLKLDAAHGAEPEPVPNDPRSVVVTVDGQRKTVSVPPGEFVLASAFLAAKPDWDAQLGPVVAIAHRDARSQGTRLTLYGADGKALYRFGGPTLPLRSLAFSGTRPLLAAAGDDGTVAVWSLKGITRQVPTIEGLLVTTRGEQVVVASVQKGSAADGKLAPDDVIEAVIDSKGKALPLKNAADFVLALRPLKVDTDVKLTVNKKAVVVKVGAGTGFRLPLFDLWVDPEVKAGRHAWIGWTNGGPYDTSGEDAEARIGWLAATGDPKRPTALTSGKQYRALFYQPDAIRKIYNTGDPVIADRVRDPATLVAEFPGAAPLPSGRLLVRAKVGPTVTFLDPDRAEDVSRGELRWQLIGPAGASEWFAEPFGGGRVALQLPAGEWTRGTYYARVRLYQRAGAGPSAVPRWEASTPAVDYVPPAPEFVARIDGKDVVPDTTVTVENEDAKAYEVSIDPKFAPDVATVKVIWGEGKSDELPRTPTGFGALKIPLAPTPTAVKVVAVNRGAPADAPMETRSVTVQVQRREKIPKPEVVLQVETEFDARQTTAHETCVVISPNVRVLASVRSVDPVASFQWRIDDGSWTDAKLAAHPTELNVWAHVLPVDLGKFPNREEKPVRVSVRATSDRKQTTEQEVKLLHAGHPLVTAAAPPADVTAPELKVSGGLNVVSRKRRFAVRIFVREPKTGLTREFDPTPNDQLTAWDAGITLFPGENQIGHVIRAEDDREVLRQEWPGLVKYARPPVVMGGTPEMEIGTGTSGNLAMAVVSAAALPPELLVHGVSCGANTSSKPVRVFGSSLWMMSAECVPANPAEKRLQPLSVVARNTERAGAAVEIPVRGEVVVPVEPPTIDLKYNGNPLSPDQRLDPVSDPNQTFELRVRSDAKLTRVEVFHGPGPNSRLERLDGVSARDAKPAGRGFELVARPAVRLRPGFENYFRVEAENGGRPVSFGFYATYTPPPVSVVIDSVEEAPDGKPNGKVTAVTPESRQALRVGPGAVLVRGRVTWLHDDEPVGKDRHLSVVFVANGVSHLPVPVSSAVPGAGRERTFAGVVYLNSPDPDPSKPGTTAVRAELRSAMLAMPQLDVERAAVTVTSQKPTVKQRLHVLIVGVGVPEADRARLVQNVVKSIGGEIPAHNPNFTEGAFKRKHFELAQVYRPQFGYVQTGHLNTMLERVRQDIAERSERRGEEWVNDVILLYYQGQDWRDEKTGRWLLHTASTLNVRPGTAPPPEQAIRPDGLPRLPGMTVVVVNVVGEKVANDRLAIDVPYLRYAWDNAKASAGLLVAVERAFRAEREMGQIGTSVHADVTKVQGFADDLLPQVVKDRVVGLKVKK